VIEFKHILCPIDFSDTSMQALAYATALATWYEAQLEVLHVVPAYAESVRSQPPGRIGDPGTPVWHAGIIAEIQRSLRETGSARGAASSRRRGSFPAG
jgi:nucleotide-binding universal stress UspA family protein